MLEEEKRAWRGTVSDRGLPHSPCLPVFATNLKPALKLYYYFMVMNVHLCTTHVSGTCLYFIVTVLPTGGGGACVETTGFAVDSWPRGGCRGQWVWVVEGVIEITVQRGSRVVSQLLAGCWGLFQSSGIPLCLALAEAGRECHIWNRS